MTAELIKEDEFNSRLENLLARLMANRNNISSLCIVTTSIDGEDEVQALGDLPHLRDLLNEMADDLNTSLAAANAKSLN